MRRSLGSYCSNMPSHNRNLKINQKTIQSNHLLTPRSLKYWQPERRAGQFSCSSHRCRCGRSGVSFSGRSNRTQCRQPLATAATFRWSCVAHWASAEPRKWTPPLLSRFEVIPWVQWRFDNFFEQPKRVWIIQDTSEKGQDLAMSALRKSFELWPAIFLNTWFSDANFCIIVLRFSFLPVHFRPSGASTP